MVGAEVECTRRGHASVRGRIGAPIAAWAIIAEEQVPLVKGQDDLLVGGCLRSR